jgi:hypothetical protein
MIHKHRTLKEAGELCDQALENSKHDDATVTALVAIASAVIALTIELHEMNERAETTLTLEGYNTEEPVDIITDFLDCAEAAVKARNEPEARRYLKRAVEHREAITEGDAALNNKLKLLDERIKFVWRWINTN